MTIIPELDPYFAGAFGAGLVALAVAAFVLRDAYLDLQAVKAAGIGNGRLRIATTELRFEIARTVVVACLTVTAAAAAFTAAGIGDDLTPLQIVPRLGLLTAIVVIVLDGLAALRYRAWLRETFHPGHPAAATVPEQTDTLEDRIADLEPDDDDHLEQRVTELEAEEARRAL